MFRPSRSLHVDGVPKDSPSACFMCKSEGPFWIWAAIWGSPREATPLTLLPLTRNSWAKASLSCGSLRSPHCVGRAVRPRDGVDQECNVSGSLCGESVHTRGLAYGHSLTS